MKLTLSKILMIIISSLSCFQCKEQQERSGITINYELPGQHPVLAVNPPKNIQTPPGMLWVPGGTFTQGAHPLDTMALPHEKPAHSVTVDGFFMDRTEVTNAQFAEFVHNTNYITVAEREVDWETLKKQLPLNTPKPHDSLLQPGSLVFKKKSSSVPNLYDYSQWWVWKTGANWKQPHGPGSTLSGKEDHPVVHIAYQDALAYCKWANRRLPTEAEWELAARGTFTNTIYTWGENNTPKHFMTNTWEGEFPVENIEKDGYLYTAPVQSYPPNTLGLYDMAGNVWEWTQDWYHASYYVELEKKGNAYNPQGPSAPHNPQNINALEKVIKGGSFLCSSSYCANYRISARMATSYDSSLEHLGFRTVATTAMIKALQKTTEE